MGYPERKLNEALVVRDVDTGAVNEELLLNAKDKETLEVFDRLKQYSSELASALADAQDSADGTGTHSGLKELSQSKDAALDSSLAKLFQAQQLLWQERLALRCHVAEIAKDLSDLNRGFQNALRLMGMLKSRRLIRLMYYLLFIPNRAYTSLLSLLGREKKPIENLDQLTSFLNEVNQSQKAADSDRTKDFSEEHPFYQIQHPYLEVDNSGTALSIFSNWASVYHKDNRMLGAKEPLISDKIDEIVQIHEAIDLTDKRILEIGPLEAANTKQMLDLGAGFVLGIEANKAAFLKSLVIKNEFNLDRSHFIYGDCNTQLESSRIAEFGPFDICLALGVLYHMENPIQTIEGITSHAGIVCVRTHVVSDKLPRGSWIKLSDSSGRVYKGRKNQYRKTDALGGLGSYAVWLTDDALIQAFEDRGYEITELQEWEKYKGRVLSFIARKK